MVHTKLNAYIKQQLSKDKEFAKHYRKEFLINEIAKLVVNLRNKTHLTQAELARKSGTTQPVIARIESGQDMRVPSLELLERIATASGMILQITFKESKREAAKKSA